MSELSCRTCKYDAEMYNSGFCTLRKDIVMEFAKEHLGFPEKFKVLDNWFMGLDPCEFYKENSLMKQLLSVSLDEEMGTLGWRVLTDVHYEGCWQHTGWVWIKTDDRHVEHIALMNGPPNGHRDFIRLLSIEELKELIVKEAEN